MNPIVYLVGAGPGDPDLLTLRALRLLQRADVVLHDDLVSPEILQLVHPAALIQNVGKRCGRKRITQEEIHARMIDAARTGQTVIRLQGGDPSLFGRTGEEMKALREAGIDFEVVPGITAAFAAAASAKISLTERNARLEGGLSHRPYLPQRRRRRLRIRHFLRRNSRDLHAGSGLR